MLFITNRALEQSHRSRSGRKVSFDMDNNEPQASVFFCETGKNQMTEVMSEGLLERLRTSKCEEILVYIHGFNNTPESAFAAAKQLQDQADAHDTKGRLLVLPMIWPNGAKPGIIRDYYDDQDRADGSAIGYARILAKFLAWREQHQDDAACLKRVSLLAHSMGNRVATKTLQRWRERENFLPRVFRNVFLVASDIENEALERGEVGHALVDAARTVTVYFADDDLALRASKVANIRNQQLTRRLGHTGPEDMNRTPSHVFAVDCNDINRETDKSGHNYFAGTAFTHMLFTIKTGRVDLNDGFVVPDNHPRSVRLLANYPQTLDNADTGATERQKLAPTTRRTRRSSSRRA